ncbi:MAG: Endo,4-beta-xylanase [Gemmatimonadetes bacterium]|nr:Endo,4-beta-xylanase [Gemmatimonadota bacterium]
MKERTKSQVHAVRLVLAAILATMLACACARPTIVPVPPQTPSLRDELRTMFLVGAAVNAAQFAGRDTAGAALVARQFNSISPENALKWQLVHPALGRYDFALADQYVDFGKRHGMFVVGHTLVWHSQLPRWVHQDSAGNPVSRDTLLARMREHIHTVVGRYRGRIGGWDVVNEALEEDGTLRKTPWLAIIGEDYLVKAYQFAHEADPAAELYYNDYSLESPAKRAGAVGLVRRLLAAGVPLRAVGLQAHQRLEWPTAAAEDSTIAAFVALGIHVNVTELDVDVLPAITRSTGADVSARAPLTAASNPFVGTLPDSIQRTLTARYAELFRVYMKHGAAIDRVTFWGVSDGDSWLNGWPVRGRTNHPLLFDRQHQPKPAFHAVVRAARIASAAAR